MENVLATSPSIEYVPLLPVVDDLSALLPSSTVTLMPGSTPPDVPSVIVPVSV